MYNQTGYSLMNIATISMYQFIGEVQIAPISIDPAFSQSFTLKDNTITCI